MLAMYELEDRMNSRGFIIESKNRGNEATFVSAHIHDKLTIENVRKTPVIKVIVNLEREDFKCSYDIKKSTTQLHSQRYSPVMNDKHFNNVVTKFELEAKWMQEFYK